jgi:hypothetical protein
MSNLYRGPSKDASYQVSIHLTNRFQRRFFRNQPTRNNWPSGFSGEDFKKSANKKQELPMVAMFVNGLGQNEQSLERTFHRCFLPSFTSFG